MGSDRSKTVRDTLQKWFMTYGAPEELGQTQGGHSQKKSKILIFSGFMLIFHAKNSAKLQIFPFFSEKLA